MKSKEIEAQKAIRLLVLVSKIAANLTIIFSALTLDFLNIQKSFEGGDDFQIYK